MALHDDDMPWYCHECKILVPKLLNSIGVITKRCDAMEDEIHHLKMRVTDIENRDSDDDEARKNMIKQECRELFQTENERVKRKNNVIIFGLPESDSPNLDTRIQADIAKIDNIIKNELGLAHVQIDKAFRLTPRVQDARANSTYKPRPTKVILASADARGEVLRNAKILKTPRDPTNKVVIVPDLCKVDKEENDKLVEELKRKRNESIAKGENCTYTIRQRRVVRIPYSGNGGALATPPRG